MMSQSLELTLRVTEEEREDRWVAKCWAMGILVYGTTQDKAREALTGAVQALVDSYRMGRGRRGHLVAEQERDPVPSA